MSGKKAKTVSFESNDNEKCTGPVVKICQFFSFGERSFLF